MARNAANSLPSAAVSVRSSWETAAPEMTGIGGAESSSKHIGREDTGAARRRFRRMREQSQTEEVNAAIGAQRERRRVPRSIAPEPPPVMPQPQSEPEPEPEKG